MQIEKQQIIDFLSAKGDRAKIELAHAQLPDHVDTDKHAGLLSKLGVEPSELFGGPSGKGNPLGL